MWCHVYETILKGGRILGEQICYFVQHVETCSLLEVSRKTGLSFALRCYQESNLVSGSYSTSDRFKTYPFEEKMRNWILWGHDSVAVQTDVSVWKTFSEACGPPRALRKPFLCLTCCTFLTFPNCVGQIVYTLIRWNLKHVPEDFGVL